MTPLDLLALGGVALLLLLVGGFVVIMLRSMDRNDRYRQANKSRHLMLDGSRPIL